MTEPTRPEPRSWSRSFVIGVFVAAALISVAYRLLVVSGAYKTSALFVGLPLLLALVLLQDRNIKSTSTTGMLIRGSTLVMLLLLVILPEGIVCFLFIAPITYALMAVIGGTIDWMRSRDVDRRMHSIIFLPLLILALEGVGGMTPFDPVATITQSRTVDATPAEVRAHIASTPEFDRPLPLFLRTGFPRPVSSQGQGLDIGDKRTISFNEKGDMRLVLEVSSVSDSHVRFTVSEHTTMVAEWLKLDWAEVRWAPTEDGRTEIWWTMSYERLLHPAVYFGPLERYGVQKTADYLLATIADPT